MYFFSSYGMLGISKQVWRSGWKWWANLLFEGRIQLPDENVLCKCQRIRSQYARCGSSDTFTNLEFRIYEFFLRILIMISFSTGKLRKIMCFELIRSLFSFSTAQTEKNLWNKIVKQICEIIWWIRNKIVDFIVNMQMLIITQLV